MKTPDHQQAASFCAVVFAAPMLPTPLTDNIKNLILCYQELVQKAAKTAELTDHAISLVDAMRNDSKKE